MNMWKRLSPVKKEIFLLLIMAGFGLVKQFLVYNLPIMAVPKGIHDDWIMVHLADTLRSGQWLGEYNSLTLTKGMFFPLYLAVINFFHLSYLNVTAFLYTVSCMVFVYALRPLVKSRCRGWRFIWPCSGIRCPIPCRPFRGCIGTAFPTFRYCSFSQVSWRSICGDGSL